MFSSAEAIEYDLGLVAESQDWTIDEARERYRAQVALSSILERIAKERPDSYVGAAHGAQPGEPPTLYVKGAADAFIADLVAKSGIDITLADDQPFSFRELEERQHQVQDALVALGFKNVTSAVDFARPDVIPAAVTAEADLPSSAEDILASLDLPVRRIVDLRVTTALPRDYTAYGGFWMIDLQSADPLQCTSGWTVEHIVTLEEGLTTAEHCPTIDRVRHSGHGDHPVVKEAWHRGTWGDIEWYTVASPNQNLLDNFVYDRDGSSYLVRDVTGVQARSGMGVGDQVCVFGRATNDRACAFILYPSMSCTSGGVTMNRLVGMDRVVSQPGDSGGGWSLGTYAWGSVVGACPAPVCCNTVEVFSVADLYDEALAVRVCSNC